jgi:tetratricopeptide (TPR) repeat protein
MAYNSPNACNSCHRDKDAKWADRLVRQWHKRDYQAPVTQVAGLIDAARKADWSKLPEILKYLEKKDRDPVFAASLARLLRTNRDSRAVPALAELLRDRSPLVRIAAVDGLAQNVSPQAVSVLLLGAVDDYRSVRIRAGAALSHFQPGNVNELTRTAFDHAVGEYVTSLQSRPDDFNRRLNLGVLYADRGQWQDSVAEYLAASRLRPDAVAPLVNVSLVYSQMGQQGKAEDSLRKAIRMDSHNAAAHFNLGLLLAAQKRGPEATEALRKALDADPSNAAAAFNLAVIVSGDHLDEAIGLCRKAADAEPAEPKYAYTLAFYLRQKGDLSGASATLQRVIDSGIGDVACYRLLTEIREQQGDAQGVMEICRKAAGNLALPQDVRIAFAVKASEKRNPGGVR